MFNSACQRPKCVSVLSCSNHNLGSTTTESILYHQFLFRNLVRLEKRSNVSVMVICHLALKLHNVPVRPCFAFDQSDSNHVGLVLHLQPEAWTSNSSSLKSSHDSENSEHENPGCYVAKAIHIMWQRMLCMLYQKSDVLSAHQ